MRGVSGSGSTRSSGRSGGQVGISNGNIELGVDLGIAGLGISFGYGGAIVVKFAGQTIVWGREGGEIRLRVGGFDVDVIAKDCVVTETKRIAGQIVSARTYHDPGCKSPDPPAPTPTPGRGNSPISTSGMTSDRLCYVLVDHNVSLSNVYPTSSMTGEGVSKITASNVPDIVPPQGLPPFFSVRADVTTSGTISQLMGGNWVTNSSTKQSTNSFSLSSTIFPAGETATFIRLDVVIPNSVVFTGGGANPVAPAIYPRIIYGKEKEIAAYLNSTNARPDWNASYSNPPYSSHNLQSLKVARIIYVGAAPAETPLPFGGNRPPMPDRCCEALKADLEDIKEVLATKEMLGRKLTFPWRLRMPGGSGEEVITDYPNLFRALAQEIDHLGIHPPKLSIKDINNAIAGDQGIDEQFPSSTRAFEAMMAKIWDANADVDTLTNFLYRLSFLCVQQSMNLARLSGDTQTIKDMLGGKTDHDIATLTTPFNIGAGVEEKPSTKGRGFGKGKNTGGKINRQIDANTELTTEELLPEFLKIRDNQICVSKFIGERDVVDMLTIIILKLESLQGR
jgi:hypothetical protein